MATRQDRDTRRSDLNDSARLATLDRTPTAVTPHARPAALRGIQPLRCACASVAPAASGRPWPPPLQHCASSHTLGSCLAFARTPLRRVRILLPSNRTPAHARVRLPLRLHLRPPSSCRAGVPRAASRSPRALTGLWRAVRHNADYPQCRRRPRSNPSRVHASSRGPSPALFARVQIVLHARTTIRARRIIRRYVNRPRASCAR